MHTFTADADTHTYTVNGERSPSVTDVIKRAGRIDSQWFTDESRRRGKAVHTLAARVDRKLLDWSDVPEAWRGYLESYRKASEYFEFVWHHVERPDYLEDHGVVVAGRPDRVGRSNILTVAHLRAPGMSSPCVADLKTGDPDPWHGLQLAAYDAIVHGLDAIDQCVRLGVYLDRGGRMARIRIYDDFTDYGDFFADMRAQHEHDHTRDQPPA